MGKRRTSHRGDNSRRRKLVRRLGALPPASTIQYKYFRSAGTYCRSSVFIARERGSISPVVYDAQELFIVTILRALINVGISRPLQMAMTSPFTKTGLLIRDKLFRRANVVEVCG